MIKISNYYKEIRLAKRQLDSILKSAKKEGTKLSIKRLMYELELTYECSKKPLLEALETAQEIYDFSIKNDEVVW